VVKGATVPFKLGTWLWTDVVAARSKTSRSFLWMLKVCSLLVRSHSMFSIIYYDPIRTHNEHDCLLSSLCILVRSEHPHGRVSKWPPFKFLYTVGKIFKLNFFGVACFFATALLNYTRERFSAK